MNMKVVTSIVPQDKWSHFEETYENNVPIACDIAMQALDEIFKSKGLVFTELMLWRKYCGDVPSFQHLCFRYKNKVISIILAMYGIDGANTAIMSEHEFDTLIAECRKYNLTPCVFPVDVVNKRPILDGWHMLDALTIKARKCGLSGNIIILVSLRLQNVCSIMESVFLKRSGLT